MVQAGEEKALCTPVFLYETCNAVMNSLRRRRIDEQAAEEYLDMIYGFPIRIDGQQAMPDVIEFSLKHALTVYDAAYLELARRLSLPLATLDVALTAAAKKEKVAVLVCGANTTAVSFI